MKLISLKVPEDVLADIDKEAENKGISRTALLLERWQLQEVIARPVYTRPAHDLSCRCYICKPPK